ncbi:hypothetical protein DTL42_15390 [Bremerella cremea]|uniref:Glycosyl transferase family 28 C-terminal domain-containing protein n=1 Tax=Bremerella cremea TaxID=1031537 RepID=A0A368KPD4_9BACT|nr:glycosyltransferase [Bremerella cremea]RCS46350.1 hypothetical protein DTL42_15390 [Bremerella cremea]
MIFVTVGNMDPFDRLIKSMDEWAGDQPTKVEILAQIGTGTYRPQHLEFVDFLTPGQYREAFNRADLVVSHAGMGSIITALESYKPMVIMPKLASLGEQRNEHQLATAKRFKRSALIQVAYDAEELFQKLSEAATSDEATVSLQKQAWPPDASLINFVRGFLTTPAATRSAQDQARSVIRETAS